uniref:C2 family cysteine protease n=1 Tax=Salmonella sp. s51228 TaxID=3159652 RepID=UPI0039810A29
LTAAISSLCHANYKFILSILLTTESYLINEGRVIVKLFYNAKWRDVTIDDYLPCDGSGDIIFAESENSITTHKIEFWVAFIEKAYAKQYGSYANLHGGNMSEAL